MTRGPSGYSFEEFEVLLESAEVQRSGEALHLEPRLMKLLVHLIESRDRLVPKEELLNAVWGESFVTEGALTKAVGRLRRALGDDPQTPRYIQTVHTLGYRFVAEVELLEALDDEALPSQTGDRQGDGVVPRMPAPMSEGVFSWSGGRRGLWAWFAAGALLATSAWIASAWIAGRDGGDSSSPPMAHASIDLLAGTSLFLDENPAVALAPNGRTLAWIAVGPDNMSRLYVRDLDRPDGRLIPGTESAYGPFFSPDGRWIAYFNRWEGRLEKVRVEGGVPTRVAGIPTASKGGAWSDRGEIVFSYGYDGGLARVSAEGGAVEMLTEPEREAGVKSHRFPQFLPGGRALLYMVCDAQIDTYNEARIEVLDLDSGERKLLVEGGMSPRYAPSGHLVFARKGRLMAAPFDLESLSLSAAPIPVFDGVVTHDTWGFGQFALVSNGTLLYAPGGPETYFDRIVRADREGRLEPMALPEREYSNALGFSPDGTRLAITVTGANFDVWLWESQTQVLSRLTAGWNNQSPRWDADGRGIFFVTDRRAPKARDIHWIPADGSTPSTPVYETLQNMWPGSPSPDGHFLAFEERSPATGWDIWILPLSEGMTPGTPERLIATDARERLPTFSPDGRWLAYVSDETGVYEAYVRPFPGPGAKRQVSSGGAWSLQWGIRGEEILYLDYITRRLMRVEVKTTPELSSGAPQVLFDFESRYNYFRIDPDGEHLVFFQRGAHADPITQLGIVFNWSDTLEDFFQD